MKTFFMKNILVTAVALLGIQMGFAQVQKNVGDFKVIKVYDKIPVELIASSQNKVEIVGELENEVDVVTKNDELKIKMSTLNLMQGDKVTVKVYYKSLFEVQASQGSMIYSEDELQTSLLKITSNEGSSIKLPIKTKKLEVKANSGSEVILKGKATSQSVIVNSGAQYYAKQLKSDNASLTTNAGGVIEANVSESVDAKTRAGGSIVIYGDPEQRSEKKIAGGTIQFKK